MTRSSPAPRMSKGSVSSAPNSSSSPLSAPRVLRSRRRSIGRCSPRSRVVASSCAPSMRVPTSRSRSLTWGRRRIRRSGDGVCVCPRRGRMCSRLSSKRSRRGGGDGCRCQGHGPDGLDRGGGPMVRRPGAGQRSRLGGRDDRGACGGAACPTGASGRRLRQSRDERPRAVHDGGRPDGRRALGAARPMATCRAVDDRRDRRRCEGRWQAARCLRGVRG